MIGLDTNVLVRYIVQDHPHQSRLATQLIEHQCTTESPGYISHIVLTELVWVLKNAYQYDKSIIIRVLQQILASAELQIENPTIARTALKEYQQNNADYPDYLIAHNNHARGCTTTITFDKKAARGIYASELTTATAK